jgi:hypothetical protein
MQQNNICLFILTNRMLSVSISKSFINPRVILIKKILDYSYHKNTEIRSIHESWILSLDSDEELSQELLDKLPELIKDDSVDGYWFRRRNYISPTRYLKYGLFYPDWQLRLFRNHQGYKYHGAVHEQLDIPYSKTKQIPVDIYHFPNHPKYTKFSDFTNLLPYVKIKAEELIKLDKSNTWYYERGVWQFMNLFLGGFIRGKGFLDGYVGLRAHLMFAWSIALSYFFAPNYRKT